MIARARVIDLIDYSGDIALQRGRLAGEDVPLADVSCILTGARTRWSGGLISFAAKYGVPVIACDWRGVPIACLTPWSENSRVGARHRAQAALSLPRKKNAWMRLVRAKIIGQAANLSHAPTSRSKLIELARDVRSGDLENREARAARTYWSHLFPHEEFARDRNGSGRNALLNYGYTILRGRVVRGIVVAGLSPTLGVWHRHRGNTFALADDLIEPFRPAIDHAVMGLPPDADITASEVKRVLVKALSQPMGRAGASVSTSINELAHQLALYVEGETARLNVPVWDVAAGG